MAAVSLEKPEKNERPERAQKTKPALNREKLLSSLWEKVSEPLDYVKVDVKELFSAKLTYVRINVWSGSPLCNAVKITRSYFVAVKPNSEVSHILPD